MELAYAYDQIEKRLSRIDFPALIKGFSRFPFALYNDAQAYMDGTYFNRPGNFIANTAVQHNGAHTAIWMLSEETYDFDVLASKLAHEMLHAYQNASGETRWANEREAMMKYHCDAVNVSARLEEASCMQKCLAGDDPEAFSRLLSLRKARRERFPYEYDYEARIEQIEGTAHFVEMNALKQLNAEKAEKRWAQAFAELADPARYFPVRAVTYLSGAAFLACLRKYTRLDTDAFTDMPFSLAAIADARACSLPDADARAEEAMACWQKRFQDTVTRALEKGDTALERDDCYLVMWNVYDGAWDGKYAVLTHFLGYIEGEALPETNEALFEKMNVLNGDFVAEVDGEYRLKRVWRQ